MKINDLIYVAGAVRPINQILSSNARFNAGFLASKKTPLHSQREQALLDSGLVKKMAVYDLATNRKSLHDKELEIATAHFKKLNSRTKPNPEGAQLAAESIGLSKGAKVRHELKPERMNRISRRILTLRAPIGVSHERAPLGANHDYLATYDTTERNTARVYRPRWAKQSKMDTVLAPSKVHLQQRDWSNQYRVHVVNNTAPSGAPQPQLGERFTERLTKRAVSKIFEAGAYVATCKDGFTTFLTLTFSRKQRLALFGATDETEDGHLFTPIKFVRDKGKIIYGKDGQYTELPEKPFKIIKVLETTMGGEMSRFIDGIKQMRRRGWFRPNGEPVCPECRAVATPYGPDRVFIELDYIWVAECPMNKDGEPNPHIHMLMNWQVDPEIFRDWAARLENIWGHGIGKLERIHTPKGASKYLVKAVGYATKGEDGDQGLIKGNRYAISSKARAPAWETLATFETDNMTAIIKELGYKLEQWKKPLERSVRRLQVQKNQAVAAKAMPHNQDQSKQDKLQQLIIRKERAMKKLVEQMKSKEMHASSRKAFSVTFDGENARERMDDFLIWAAGARGWSMNLTGMYFGEQEINGELVPVFSKPDEFFTDMRQVREYAANKYQHEFQRFQDRRAYWKSVFENPPHIEEVNDDERNHMLSMIHADLGSRYTVRQRRETGAIH